MRRGAEEIERWSNFINEIRSFFTVRNHLEVFTPCLVPAGAFEGVIDALKVNFSGGTAELHTSPEIAMKRLLSLHRRSLFQICPSFRDDPETGHHFREFSMLEFYTVGNSYLDAQNVVAELFRSLGVTTPIEKVSVLDRLHRDTGFRPNMPISRDQLADRWLQLGIHTDKNDSMNDLLMKWVLERLEPSLPQDRPCFVTDYPSCLAVLAKRADNGAAERFEVYWQGLELCNGCTEETNLELLKSRWEDEMRERGKRGLEAHPEPTTLWQALKVGLPDCAGVAIGLDRLFHCLTQTAGLDGSNPLGASHSAP